MDFKQLEYIIKIAEENNITHAAEKIFITQSALNQQLLKLEKELGVQLFHRSRNNWRLTEAGKIYVDNAKKILKIKNDTYNRIYDQLDDNYGEISIGLTPGRGIELFALLFNKLKEQFPNVTIKPVELSVQDQQIKIEKGELDLGFLTLAKSQRTEDEYIVLYSEEMVLAVAKNHPFTELHKLDEVIDISYLKDEPFVLMDKYSTNRALLDEYFRKNHFIPKVLFETRFTSSIVTTISSSICCGIIPEYYAKHNSDSIVYYRLSNNPPEWDVVLSYKKGTYLSKPAKAFINLAKDTYK